MQRVCIAEIFDQCLVRSELPLYIRNRKGADDDEGGQIRGTLLDLFALPADAARSTLRLIGRDKRRTRNGGDLLVDPLDVLRDIRVACDEASLLGEDVDQSARLCAFRVAKRFGGPAFFDEESDETFVRRLLVGNEANLADFSVDGRPLTLDRVDRARARMPRAPRRPSGRYPASA